MNKNPSVSVIIPVYNGEKTIAETIKSVLNQTFSDFELIIINDGSTDGTEQVVSNFSDKRIKLINIKNSGPSAARNKGIEEAKGEYVSFIDSDDLWSQDKIEKQLDKLINNMEYGVAYSWTIFIDENSKYIHPLKKVDYQGNVSEKIIKGNFVGSGSNILVKKEAVKSIGYYCISLRYGEDWDYLIRLAQSYEFILVKDFHVFYRRKLNSLSSNVSALEDSSVKILNKYRERFSQDKEKSINEALSNIKLYSSYLYLTGLNNEIRWRVSYEKLREAINIYSPSRFRFTTISLTFLLAITYLMPSRYTKSFIKYCLKLYGRLACFLYSNLKNCVKKYNL